MIPYRLRAVGCFILDNIGDILNTIIVLILPLVAYLLLYNIYIPYIKAPIDRLTGWIQSEISGAIVSGLSYIIGACGAAIKALLDALRNLFFINIAISIAVIIVIFVAVIAIEGSYNYDPDNKCKRKTK
jgi:uncharacterized membrane protein